MGLDPAFVPHSSSLSLTLDFDRLSHFVQKTVFVMGDLGTVFPDARSVDQAWEQMT